MDTDSPATTLRRLVMGFQPTHLIYAAAELGIPDLLADGPLSSGTLAARVGVQSGPLHRVLRGLAQLGVFAQAEDGRYSLTPIGQMLRTDVPGSLRPMARLWGHAIVQRPYLDLLHTVSTGEVAFDHAFGQPFFDYLATHPREGTIFNRGMASGTAPHVDGVVAAYDFSKLRTIVDIGGGNGTLLTAILLAHPLLHGTIVDLPHVRTEAERTIAAAGLADRCRFEAGDCFEAVPAADAHLLKTIVHDWDDSDSTRILRTCHRALPPHGRLLIVERVLSPDGRPAADAVMHDIHMLMVLKGRERTTADFRSLFEQSGFRLVQITPLPTGMSLIEGAPR